MQEPYRGQGYASWIMKPLLAECNARQIPCTLETQTPSNLPIYERYQFRTVQVIPLQGSTLEQYCMVYSPPDAVST
ncbi:N-acetyltransferase [Paenibacillus terrigena]|uniref:N-acetyltransferase n=1 Tax=Paenibacillus terrigena TaxID=369333 RepID=UPI0003727A58|nr:N-acetyltransferase [Paenibacillus terrigena]